MSGVSARSIPELCGCGRPVRYILATNPNQNSCNKYARCPSWEDLKSRLEATSALCRTLASMVDTCSNGYCGICARHRPYVFNAGKAVPGICENKDCLSREIAKFMHPAGQPVVVKEALDEGPSH